MVDATEQNVADVLRELLQNPKRRAELGKRAREFAVAWHGAEACAERYEKVIDRIRAGLKPDSPDLYPAAQLQ
jgi:glycosyltransferase involved in cell wall biosynthesis